MCGSSPRHIRIVVPAYKSGKTITACIAALDRSAQDLDYEIFVVDDGGHPDLASLLSIFLSLSSRQAAVAVRLQRGTWARAALAATFWSSSMPT